MQIRSLAIYDGSSRLYGRNRQFEVQLDILDLGVRNAVPTEAGCFCIFSRGVE